MSKIYRNDLNFDISLKKLKIFQLVCYSDIRIRKSYIRTLKIYLYLYAVMDKICLIHEFLFKMTKIYSN